MENSIHIGISACLLGHNVRYDGGNRLMPAFRDAADVVWMPVCPEAGSGLSVPREPMRLVRSGSYVRMMTIETGIDQTERILNWTRSAPELRSIRHLAGFLLKARSPSCAVRDAEMVNETGDVVGRGPGIFARQLALQFPALPLADESIATDPAAWKDFFSRARALHNARTIAGRAG